MLLVFPAPEVSAEIEGGHFPDCPLEVGTVPPDVVEPIWARGLRVVTVTLSL